MAKTYTAQTVSPVQAINAVWEAGAIVMLMVTVEVEYGEMGLTHQVNVWPCLTQTQKNHVSDFLAKAGQALNQIFLS